MAPVFAHGRLRLYLLKLLDEAPRHGYEVIRLLEERFQGLYAPSAGTVYPRLAKLEAEGLVTHASEGGRKVYSITEAGRAELAGRSGELADLEMEIRESVSELAAEIRADVSGSANDLRREIRQAAKEARRTSAGAAGGGRTADAGPGGGSGAGKPFPGFPDASDFLDGNWTDKEGWRQAKEDFKRAKLEWKEQARRAKDESRRAREDAQQARRQAREAQDYAREQLQRVAEQVQDHFARGDWPAGVREGLAEFTRELGRFGRTAEPGAGTRTDTDSGARTTAGTDGTSTGAAPGAGTETSAGPDTAAPVGLGKTDVDREDGRPAPEPDWAHEEPSGNPARDLDRLLDRFRDDIRDAARDHGVTDSQLRDARRHLSAAAAHIGAALRGPGA
ncbi:PadR family transcriptional regulator [Streptomyces sp. NBC_01197]|uniref:PadR family transcriptional regulator n=1 Tax=Streptomyces sp. NBC_01197 TaxID=2903768 RepID=UPI002E167CC8|nr:helix-turn-helix transcriptional regulator [Streptomyces sp. NBC_01197]